jgi:glycosyltransferase involved in cell wall biosynthesis
MKPLVSICCITYNHIHFLDQCIKGFLMQKTNFPIEILIHDDASTDGTTELIKTYVAKYPEIIKPTYQKENQFSKGKRITPILIQKAQGKYIALCEGDDYWTDPFKLQKQVDFLEGNVEYGMCEHVVEETHQKSKVTRQIPAIKQSKDFFIEDYIQYNIGATCSLVFRRQLLNDYFLQKLHKYPFGDWPLKLFLLKYSNKKSRMLEDSMGVYRIHDKSIHGSFHLKKNGLVTAYKQHLLFVSLLQKDLLEDKAFQKPIMKKKINTINNILKLSHNSFEKLQYFIQLSYLNILNRIKK